MNVTIAIAAVALTPSHPHAPARDVLNLVMQDYDGPAIEVELRSPFGQVTTAAFDR